MSRTLAFLDGGGEMGDRIRNHDWASTPLGSIETWPVSLRTVVALMLRSGLRTYLTWGAHQICLYNDAFIKTLGSKHPDSLGQPVHELFSEIWDSLRPLNEAVLRGESLCFEDMPFAIDGRTEKMGWFSFTNSPLLDDNNKVAGVHCSGFETTEKVLALRELESSKQLLRELNQTLEKQVADRTQERDKSYVAERVQSFQLALSDRLRSLTSAEEIIAAANELLGIQTGVARVVLCEINDVAGTFKIRRDWCQAGTQSIAGTNYLLDDFGSEIIALMRSETDVIIEDALTDPRTAPYVEAYSLIDVRANLSISLVRSGLLKIVLSLHHSSPHKWTDDEIQMARDMAERTWAAIETARAQAELDNERYQSQYVFNSMAEGFAVLDRHWIILRVNAEGLRLMRCYADDIIGHNYWEVFSKLKGTDTEEIFRGVMETGEAAIIEISYSWPDASHSWVEIRAYRTLDNGIALFFRDVTERRDVQEKLRLADRRKDEFLAMLAHELRNPLAPIGAAAELLQLAKLDEERVRQTSKIIARQVSHMTGLVNDLLDVSRVTSGLVELDNAPTDLRMVVADAVEQVTPIIRTRRHRLVLQQPTDNTMVMGDKKRLVQIVVNLLNNAAKYTPDGGNILLKINSHEKYVLIEVLDDGIGMESNLVEHVFDLFSQAKRSSDRTLGGLGLGLALVKSLTELHGGTVSCKSDGPSKGSLFSVCLPRLNDVHNEAAQVPRNDDQRSTTHSLRVLVVDDNIDAAQVLAMYLQALGHEVMVEHGAKQALERAQIELPQVFLLDIGLPEMDGHELAKRLRSQAETANAVLIAVTGYGQEDDRKNSIAAGFNHHLVKPVDTKKLASIFAELKPG